MFFQIKLQLISFNSIATHLPCRYAQIACCAYVPGLPLRTTSNISKYVMLRLLTWATHMLSKTCDFCLLFMLCKYGCALLAMQQARKQVRRHNMCRLSALLCFYATQQAIGHISISVLAKHVRTCKALPAFCYAPAEQAKQSIKYAL